MNYFVYGLVLGLIIGGACSGIVFYVAFGPTPHTKIEHVVSFGCFNANATEFKQSGFTYIFTVQTRPYWFANNLAFSTTTGTYPNGTTWENLVVNC